MKRRSKKEVTAKITDKVLLASFADGSEVDEITSAPDLFAAVRMRIAREKDLQTSTVGQPPSRSRSLRPAAGFAAAAMAAGLLAAAQVGLPGDGPNIAVSDATPAVFEGTVVSAAAGDVTTAGEEQVSTKHTTHNVVSRPRVQRELRRDDRDELDELGDFQAVTYFGEAVDDDVLQVIRVELPRVSLYAMGVDVPVENDGSVIKTDLLLGSDGVMKAVRVVRTEQ